MFVAHESSAFLFILFLNNKDNKKSRNKKNRHSCDRTYEQNKIWAVRMSLSWKLNGNYVENH